MTKDNKLYCNMCGEPISEDSLYWNDFYSDETRDFHVCNACMYDEHRAIACPLCEKAYPDTSEFFVTLPSYFVWRDINDDMLELNQVCKDCFKSKLFPDVTKLFKEQHLI